MSTIGLIQKQLRINEAEILELTGILKRKQQDCFELLMILVQEENHLELMSREHTLIDATEGLFEESTQTTRE